MYHRIKEVRARERTQIVSHGIEPHHHRQEEHTDANIQGQKDCDRMELQGPAPQQGIQKDSRTDELHCRQKASDDLQHSRTWPLAHPSISRQQTGSRRRTQCLPPGVEKDETDAVPERQQQGPNASLEHKQASMNRLGQTTPTAASSREDLQQVASEGFSILPRVTSVDQP
jgi:hypothetical protein